MKSLRVSKHERKSKKKIQRNEDNLVIPNFGPLCLLLALSSDKSTFHHPFLHSWYTAIVCISTELSYIFGRDERNVIFAFCNCSRCDESKKKVFIALFSRALTIENNGRNTVKSWFIIGPQATTKRTRRYGDRKNSRGDYLSWIIKYTNAGWGFSSSDSCKLRYGRVNRRIPFFGMMMHSSLMPQRYLICTYVRMYSMAIINGESSEL